MVKSLNGKVNVELLKINKELSDIIIRGEAEHKAEGIIIHCTDNKSLDY